MGFPDFTYFEKSVIVDLKIVWNSEP